MVGDHPIKLSSFRPWMRFSYPFDTAVVEVKCKALLINFNFTLD